MNKLRWQLTIQFVSFTVVIYIILTGMGLYLCYRELNNALDDQLQLLASEVVEQIDFDGSRLIWVRPNHPTAASSKRKTAVKAALPEEGPPDGGTNVPALQAFRLLASYQLFDARRHLLNQYGMAGFPELFDGRREINGWRSLSLPIVEQYEGKTIHGYLQVQLPTRQRDRSMSKFGLAMSIVILAGLIVLSAAGLVFSQRAARPLMLSYEMLRQFSTDAAHELNTPISTVKATAENMMEELDDPESLKARLEVINRSLDRMSNIVRDLMLLTKLGMEAEQPSRQQEEVNLGELAGKTADEFRSRFQAKGIDFHLDLSATPTVNGYPDPLARLLGNLLENALKYTESGGSVTLSLKLAHGQAVLSVADTGAGIPVESREKIFDRFYRVDQGRSRDKGGSGLGLAIVKAIADMHSASISVESEPEIGSKFTFSMQASG